MPTNLVETSATTTAIGISWDPVVSLDTVEYVVYTNGGNPVTVQTNNAELTGVYVAEQTYNITVASKLTGTLSQSAQSAPLQVTIPA